MDQSHAFNSRLRASSIKEMCQKFEQTETKPVETKSPLTKTNVNSPYVTKNQKYDVKPSPLKPKPSSSPQWSKSKAQYEELIQKRQQQKLGLKQNEISDLMLLSPAFENINNIQRKKSVSVSETLKLFESSGVSEPSSPISIHRASYVLPNHSLSNGSSPIKNSLNGYSTHITPPKPVPPRKPPRTFAHNVYIQQHMHHDTGRNLLNGSKQKYPPNCIGHEVLLNPKAEKHHFINKSPNPEHFVDLTVTTLGPPKNYGTLKRSFSEEHVYADPLETVYAQRTSPSATLPEYAQPFRLNKKSPNHQENFNKKQLHYMSTPIVGIDIENQSSLKTVHNLTKQGKSSSPNVRELVNNSFSQLWRRLYTKNTLEGLDPDDDVTGDSGSEVSMKDVQERIIYVRSLKKQIMGARNLGAVLPDCLFDSILISCLTPARKDSSPKPRLIYRYPNQQETIYDQTMIPQLCFPDCATLKTTTSYKSETFVFSVEDERGNKTFGYCLRLLGSNSIPKTAFLTLPAVICLISCNNFIGFYMKILSEVEKHLLLGETEFLDYIAQLYNTRMPLPGASVEIPDFTQTISSATVQVFRPMDNRIVNAELTFLLQLLEVDLLLEVLASLLLERRVLLVAASSSTLFKCTTAILALLYPLSWQHSVLPVLPQTLLAQCCASSPYLFGVPSHYIHKVMDMQKEKLLVVDLDQGFLLRSVGDEHTILPGRSLKAVKCALNLAKNMTDPTEMLRDVMISEAFVRMFVETLGHCDNCISEQEPGRFVFQLESFSKFPSSRSIQMFLAWFCETQMFDAFIDERINIMKTQHIRKQPGYQTHKGLFDRRIEEFWSQHQSSNSLRENVRELGKKVRTFGVKLKHFRAF